MKHTLRKSLSWLLVLATLFSLCAAMSVGVSAATVALGKAGDNIEAYYDKDNKTLHLKGSGSMTDYVEDGKAGLYTGISPRPWDEYRREIEKVSIDEGITTIGNAAFYNMLYLRSCNIPTTVQTIGEWAFGETAITSVIIPANTRLVKHFAFFSSALPTDGQNSVCLGATVIENEHITSIYDGAVVGASQTTNSELVNDLDRTASGNVVINASGTVPTGIKWTYSTATKVLELTYDGSGVATMADLAMARPWDTYMNEVQSVVVGDGIGNLGAYAFVGATNLRSITLGKDVAKIGSRAFAGCVSLTSLTLPLATLTVEDEAFYSRNTYITVTTPNAKVTMDPGNKCANSPYVTWNYGTVVNTPTTPSTPAAGQNGVLAGGISWIYTNGVLMLTSAQPGASIPSYPSYANTPWAQAGLSSSINSVMIGSNIISIGQHAFANLPYLSNVALGADVMLINSYAFASSPSLRTINFPAAVLVVDSNAFTGSGLLLATKQNPAMDVKNPNVELLNALNNTGSSTTPDATQSGTISGTALTWSYNPTTRQLTISGEGALPDNASSNTTPWGLAGLNGQITSILIGDGVTRIGKYSFSNLSSLSSVTLGSGLKSIGQYAFANNASLRSIALPASLTTVEGFAFYGCSALTTATKASTATTIGEPNTELMNALGQQSTPTNPSGTISGTALGWEYTPATGALSIYGEGDIPDFINYTQSPWAKAGLSNQIKTIFIGSAVTGIGKYAFANLSQLTSVFIGMNVRTIGQYAFGYDTALTSVDLPSSVAEVKANAFTGCSKLRTATKANSATTIADPNTELKNALNSQSQGGTVTPPSTSTDASGLFAGNKLEWSYTADRNRLMIYPVGAVTTKIEMPDFSASSPAPWNYLSSNITNVIISIDISTIGAYAFANMPYLQSVSVGEDIETVGSYAFYNNIRLSSITFPASVKTVMPYAFTGCTTLRSATKYNTTMKVQTPNTELLSVLGNPSTPDTPSTPSTPGSTVTGTIDGTLLTWSYDHTTNALNITGSGAIPNYSATKPAPWSSYAPMIKAVMIQTGVTAIGSCAFTNITNVVDIYLPDTITLIGNDAFAGCTALESVRLPAALSSLGAGAFRSCSSLKSIELPAQVAKINDYTFYGCSSLESVKLSSNLLTIGIEAFYGCTSLKSIDLPSLLSTIEVRGFYGCSALESVVFHSSNLSIGVDAFGGCTALKKAVYTTNPPTAATGNELLTSKYVSRYNSGAGWMSNRAEGTLTLSGAGEITSSAAWKDELKYVDTIIFDNGVTGIGANLLKSDNNIVRVEMADTVTTIGAGAFENCTHLESVSLSKGLTTLGERAFYGCSVLTSVKLPNLLKIIPESAFAYCISLASVDMGQSVMMIRENAFANCIKLDNVDLPASLRVIYEGAFNNCSELTTLTLRSDNVNALSQNTFDQCVRLSKVNFHGTKAQWETIVANADSEIASAAVTYYVKLTVNHVYAGGPLDGQAVASPDVLSAVAGDTLTVKVKDCDEHYEVGEFDATVTMGSANQTVTVTYAPKTYTLTIQFKDADTGKKIGADRTVSVKYGDSYEAAAGTLEGYTVVDGRIYVESMPGDYTYEVKFNKNVYTYTVEYVNTKTNKVIGTKEGQAKHGESVVAETPEMTGYTLVEGTYEIAELTSDGQKITVKYQPSQKSLTIEYVDAQGNKIADPVTKAFYYGDEVKIVSPVITGKVADKETVLLESYNGEDKITVTYNWRYYTVTIRFLEKDSYGYQIRPDYVLSVKHGDAFTFAMDESYNEAAYVTDKSSVTFASVISDMTETITYSPKPLKLTIEYKNADGKLLGTAEQTVYAGQSYTVEEHTIKNYLQTEEPVSGTMGVEDKTITIELEKDPDAGKVGKVILIIAVILLVLGTGGALFYFLYLKKKPY